ncbi:MAG: recombination mediator RecR [bacterium]
MSKEYARSLDSLIAEFQKMPGIGPKSAQRLAFYILSITPKEVEALAGALKEAKEKLKPCSKCFNITDVNPCVICADSYRDQNIVCVVSEPKDLIAIEKTREYKGVYHVLGGVISPLSGIGPDSLRIKELLERLKNEQVNEIIIATNPTTEGEATALYLNKLIKPLGVRITRIAYGLPIGSDMDYADEVTLAKSFEGRREL